MLSLINRAEEIQANIDKVFSTAYKALQHANISLGISTLQQVGNAVPEEDGIELKSRSNMDVEISTVNIKEQENIKVNYGFFRTNYFLDIAYENLTRLKCFALK